MGMTVGCHLESERLLIKFGVEERKASRENRQEMAFFAKISLFFARVNQDFHKNLEMHM